MTECGQLLGLIGSHAGREALVWRDRSCSFESLLAEEHRLTAMLDGLGVPEGAVIGVEGDFTPAGVAALLACMRRRAIAVPLTRSAEAKKPEFYDTAEIEWSLRINSEDHAVAEPAGRRASHDLIATLRERKHPGLVLFSSGSTGRSKGVVHDWELLVRKYLKPRHCYRTLAFLLYDHIGGIDTLFYSLANGSALITVPDHSPETACAAIERHRVEVLPVSPTFLNLLLLSGAHTRHDLSSLKIITYGAEVMPETTLQRVAEVFPSVRLLQKFGATEIGTLRSQSRESSSSWVRIGGEGYQTRVVDGLLEIKADAAMLGYLNAPSPFTEDGWFKTGDAVEVDGDFMRILGRKSEMINVGGEKVYPAEVEGVLLQMPGVKDAVIVGEPNPITGNIVVAQVNLESPEDPAAFRKRLREFCRGRLADYKVPARVRIMEAAQYSARFKRMRATQHAP